MKTTFPALRRRFLCTALFAVWAGVAPAQLSAQIPTQAPARPATLPATCYLFCSFRDNGQDGLHLAWSADGYTWTALNNDRSFLAPKVGTEKLMRDPCIFQSPDGTFHLVWTDSWADHSIGYSSSRDLITWTPQQAIPVMAREPQARNCWAPEIIFDDRRHEYLLYWATTISGRFPATDHTAESNYNHRIYATTTKDFVAFTPTRLFFDPGFNVIDATLLRDQGKWFLFFKDETKDPVPRKNLRVATADDLEGPYHVDSRPVTRPGVWVEGPTVLRVGNETLLYCDSYRENRFLTFRSHDLVTWEDVSKLVSLPQGTRHGTAFPISRNLLQTLLTRDRTP